MPMCIYKYYCHIKYAICIEYHCYYCGEKNHCHRFVSILLVRCHICLDDFVYGLLAMLINNLWPTVWIRVLLVLTDTFPIDKPFFFVCWDVFRSSSYTQSYHNNVVIVVYFLFVKKKKKRLWKAEGWQQGWRNILYIIFVWVTFCMSVMIPIRMVWYPGTGPKQCYHPLRPPTRGQSGFISPWFVSSTYWIKP